jgi:hypothetical protein
MVVPFTLMLTGRVLGRIRIIEFGPVGLSAVWEFLECSI